jgi:hypothetical protein
MPPQSDLYQVQPSATATPTMSCSRCTLPYPDHHPKCPYYTYGLGVGPDMPDEIRCDYLSPTTHYGGGPHKIPESGRRCGSRKSLHDAQFCRSHRRQHDRKVSRTKLRVKNPHVEGLRKALELMDQIERAPNVAEEERWQTLKTLLRAVV